jgi:hypothetical protein
MSKHFQGWRSYQDKSAPKKGFRKFGNKEELVGEIKFDSKKEAARYRQLLMMEHAGMIKDLQLQVSFSLMVNGTLIGKYTSDFTYYENGMYVVEDTKGYRSRDYPLRKKLMKAIYDIEIKET